MNLRFAGMITGCMLIGASAAAYYRTDSRPAPSGATLASAADETPTSVSLQAAIEAPAPAAWPPVVSVAFYEAMFEQLPAATAPTRGANAGTSDQQALVPIRVANAGGPQTPPVRRINMRPGPGQPPAAHFNAPPAGNATMASGGEPTSPEDDLNAAPDAGQTPPEHESNAGNGGQRPHRAGTTRPRESADMVEVVIRDRFGRPIRVERVDRRLLTGAPAYPPPPPYRSYHSYPDGPHGGHGHHGPYGLYR